MCRDQLDSSGEYSVAGQGRQVPSTKRAAAQRRGCSGRLESFSGHLRQMSALGPGQGIRASSLPGAGECSHMSAHSTRVWLLAAQKRAQGPGPWLAELHCSGYRYTIVYRYILLSIPVVHNWPPAWPPIPSQQPPWRMWEIIVFRVSDAFRTQ